MNEISSKNTRVPSTIQSVGVRVRRLNGGSFGTWLRVGSSGRTWRCIEPRRDARPARIDDASTGSGPGPAQRMPVSTVKATST